MRIPRNLRVIVAADHGGVGLKADLLEFLTGKGVAVRDIGTNSEDPVDYPDYGFAAAEALRRRDADRAILICKSGIGMSIAANKSIGVRAALVSSVEAAELSRRHNDANVLVLSANEMSAEAVRTIVGVWLSAPFDGGRHSRRVDKIRAFEVSHWKE